MGTRIFECSEEKIQTAKMRVFLEGLVILPRLAFFLLFVGNTEGDNLGAPRVGSFVFILAIFEAWLFVSSEKMLARIKQSKIRLSNEYVEREQGLSFEHLAYQDLTRVVVRENKSGEIIVIRLYSPRRQMLIHGFCDMNQLFDGIAQRIPDSVEVRRKRIAIDWSKPFVYFVFGVLLTIISLGLIFYIEGLGDDIAGFFFSLVSVCTGIWFLKYRPLSSSSGVRFRKYETFFGIAQLVLGIFLLIFQAVS